MTAPYVRVMKILPLLPLLLSLTAVAAEPARVIDSTAFVIEEAFVDAARGREIAKALRDKRIDQTLEGAALAQAVTDAIWSIEDDGHLNVRYDPAKASEPLATREQLRERLAAPPQRTMPRPGAGGKTGPQFTSKMLDGNVGYLDIATFLESPSSHDEIDAAMKTIEGASSVIVDLRRNPGGSQFLVDYLASYFLPADGRELMTARFRHLPQPMVGHVLDTPTRKFEKVPVTILISEKTFSAGEAFAYLLQQFGRAKVVGAKTRGGGRPNRFVDLGAGYTVSVSIGMVTHPKSGTGWQLTGVIPDVAVPAEQALDVALKAAPARSS
jgi:retinol-binding protein 3